MNKYFIKEGYKINEKIETFDRSAEKTFWNKKNIKISSSSQYYVYELAYKIARQNGIKAVLDIGCGVATQLDRFFGRRFSIYGVDQESAINICRKRYDYGVFLSTNLESPGQELKRHIEKAPLIICADVIEHLRDPDRLLGYIKSFADDNTVIIISTPERNLLGKGSSSSPRNPYHVREWNSREFRDYLIDSSFKVTSQQIVPTCKLYFNLTTVKFIVGQLVEGASIKYTQVVICNKTAKGAEDCSVKTQSLPAYGK